MGNPFSSYTISACFQARFAGVVAALYFLATTGTLLFAQTARKPNIIFIMGDDMGYGDVGCYGSKHGKTPHIDALARQGIRFTDFHSNGSVCTPARAAFLSGRYQQRCKHVPDDELTPVFQEQRRKNMLQRWAWGISLDEVTIADHFRSHGYRTGLIGKWHLGYDFKFHPMNQGFDEFRGWLGGGVDQHTHIARHGLKTLDWWNGKTIEDEEGYATDLLGDYAVDFIARQRDRPFFLYAAHGAVHTTWQGRDPTRRGTQREYLEVIEALDDNVGKVVAAVREHGLENDTLVVFCSDNGPVKNTGFRAAGPLRGSKGNLYEGGHRMPLIARMPGRIPAGLVTDETVMMMDMFPTFCAIANVPVPKNRKLDGVDLTSVLQGKRGPADRVFHWLQVEDWAIRKGPWKLMGKAARATKLFNLDKDLGEEENLLESEPEHVAQLLGLHREWRRNVAGGEPGNAPPTRQRKDGRR